MLNTITLMGRLTRDPELRTTQSGVNVTTFSIACDRDRSANGEKQTDFFNITAWRGTADFVYKYFKKGRMVALVGRLQTRQYEDKDGNKRTATEIVADSVYFADSNNNAGNGENVQETRKTGTPTRDDFQQLKDAYSGIVTLEGEDGDLPF